MTETNKRPKIVLVGAGLIGSLNALFFGQCDKFDVFVYEKMSDLRIDKKSAGRSINLSLSYRGICALNAVGLDELILKMCVPMYSRMVHYTNKKENKVPYGKKNQRIYALDRRLFNEILLNEAEKNPNVKIKFNSTLLSVDFSNKIAKFSSENEIISVEYDFLVGNDGAHSTVRYYLSRNLNLDLTQHYIPHGYKELHIPPVKGNQFQMDKNSMHMWPREDYMLVSLPNLDGSFTSILFMPFTLFETIKNRDDLFTFFENNFPDALEYMGKQNLEEKFFSKDVSSMVSIWCNPYHYQSSCVIMGDAAHAQVPFYGQGMNCGFEDVLIFHEILKKNNFQFENTCSEYTNTRNEDSKTICQLSFRNYIEIRKDVAEKSFLLRKKLDNFLNLLFPSFWIPLYTMVTFTRIPYSKCLKERQKQDKILKIMKYCFITGSILLGITILKKSRINIKSYIKIF